MISEKILKNLHNDIQIYDKKNGKDYLIVCSKGKNDKLKCCQITYNHFNFWHLLGCKIESENHLATYEACKAKEDVAVDISLVHSYAEAEVKHIVFEKVFDFVTNAKLIKVGYIGNCPEQFYLTMSMGNEVGFVGYDYPRDGNKNYLIPKSVQSKKISSVASNLNKILFIVSKQQNQDAYTNVEYEIKKGIMSEHLSEIPENIKIGISG